jgi:predicted nucleic acid-binding protein
MIYLDTSCLLKLLREELESPAVSAAVADENTVIVSSLVELEAEVQLKAAKLGGQISTSQWRQFQAQLVSMRNFDPFHFRHLPASIFSTALKQHRSSRGAYCRSLDRLHLAAMEELKVRRLMTLDRGQASTAAALNYEIVEPGRRD